MSLAVAISTSTPAPTPHSVPIVILGTDAVLAALPATAVQLAHACMHAGFTSVIPASWGDELIAAAMLRRLKDFGDGPAIACTCPIVAHRLLSASGDLRPVLLPFVAPPVAVARYVRVLTQPSPARITYVGNCPGASDESIDIRMTPEALLATFGERHIVLEEQPRIFESVIPADRRRFRSQPGGLPNAEALWSESGSRALIEVHGEQLVTEIAQHVLTGEKVLIDAAMALGCACSGAVGGGDPREGRSGVTALEPPRANAPVVDESAPIQLTLQVPVSPRTPSDVLAVSAKPMSAPAVSDTHHTSAPQSSNGSSVAPPPALEPSASRPAAPSQHMSPPTRPVVGITPGARQIEGRDRRSLPRAYIVRRRSSPRGTPIIPAPRADPPHPAQPEPTRPIGADQQVENPERERSDARVDTTALPHEENGRYRGNGNSSGTDEHHRTAEVALSVNNGTPGQTHVARAPGASDPVLARPVEVIEPTEQAERVRVVDAAGQPKSTAADGSEFDTESSSTVSPVTTEAEVAPAEHPHVDVPDAEGAESAAAAHDTNGRAPQAAAIAEDTGATTKTAPPEPTETSLIVGSAPAESNALQRTSTVAEPAATAPIVQLSPLKPRHVVLLMLVVVGVAVASAVIAVMVERHFSAPIAASTPGT